MVGHKAKQGFSLAAAAGAIRHNVAAVMLGCWGWRRVTGGGGHKVGLQGARLYKAFRCYKVTLAGRSGWASLLSKAGFGRNNVIVNVKGHHRNTGQQQVCHCNVHCLHRVCQPWSHKGFAEVSYRSTPEHTP